MAESDTDNVIPLAPHSATPGGTSGGTSGAPLRRKRDHRAAARQARKRSKNKSHRDAAVLQPVPKATESAPDIATDTASHNLPAAIASVTLPALADEAPPEHAPEPATYTAFQPVERHDIDRLTLVSALSLAAVSGGFSIYGMTSIFVGSFWPVIAMGVALELGKLRAVTWIGRHGSAPWWGLKGALTVLVLVLMGLNVIGAFGFLAKAHIGHQVEGETAVAGRAADIDARISVQADEVADLDRRIAQIDAAVDKTTSRGRTSAAMQLAADQRRNRGDLAAQRDQANRRLADLRADKARVDGDRKVADADLGPVRYLATLIGAGDQDVLRWFILIVALLLDPAAALLLLAATRRG
jgi:hypothetical protein